MKTKNKIISLIIIMFVIFIGTVKAEDKDPLKVTCPSSSKAELLKYASNVSITYEPYEYKADGFDDPNSSNYSVMYYYLDIKIHNLDAYVYAEINGSNGNTYNVYYDQIGSDGAITLRQKDTSKITNYVINIKANTADCNGENLRTIKLTLPKYNQYSDRTVCSDIPDYYLCQQYIFYDVDSDKFLKSVEDYKAKLVKNSEDKKEVDENNTNVISATASKISKHKYLIVSTIIIIGCVITFVVIKKKRSSVL